jgi:hypothetical protein
MLKLLERNIAAAANRIVLLAPPHLPAPEFSSNVISDPQQHRDLVHEMQRLRGGVYLNDGALTRDQLSRDGRHETPEDQESWHLLVQDEQGRVTGCIWYLEHQNMPGFEQLRLRHSSLARDREWGHKLRAAVTSDVARARSEGIRYAEVGGWAVAKDSCLTDCLLLILGAYGLSQILGGALVVATATVRNASASVLRRLGGSHLEGDGYVVPAYYDPKYDCQMEILRFDARRPRAQFARMVESLRAAFASIPVFAVDGAMVEGSTSVASAPSGLVTQQVHLAVA